MNIYKILADFVFWFHWLWAAAILFGIFVSIKFPKYRPVHHMVLLVTITSQIIWLGCPLVALESSLRAHYQKPSIFSGSFVCDGIRHLFGVIVPPWVIVVWFVLIVLVAIMIELKYPRYKFLR